MTTHILVVEDNPIDVRLLRAAFDRVSDWDTEIAVAEDGEEAIDYLRSEESQTKTDLVILDLNLPKRDGMDVLRVIRTELSNNRLPVIIFSSAPEDGVRSQMHRVNLSADAYFRKPTELGAFLTLAEHFRHCYESASARGVDRGSIFASADLPSS